VKAVRAAKKRIPAEAEEAIGRKLDRLQSETEVKKWLGEDRYRELSNLLVQVQCSCSGLRGPFDRDSATALTAREALENLRGLLDEILTGRRNEPGD
jgi:hypothetical protein